MPQGYAKLSGTNLSKEAVAAFAPSLHDRPRFARKANWRTRNRIGGHGRAIKLNKFANVVRRPARPSTEGIAAASGIRISSRRQGALLVGSGPFTFSNREPMVALAARHWLPASYSQREYAKGITFALEYSACVA